MLKLKLTLLVILLLPVILISGCGKDNPVTQKTETLVFQRDGIIESFGGDCSAVQIRTSIIDSLDFTNAGTVKFKFSGMSDADLSSIVIFYINSFGEQVNLVNLPHRDQINSTGMVEITAPDYSGELFLRVTLKSSVCTGQIFHIEVRDLKIYTIK